VRSTQAGITWRSHSMKNLFCTMCSTKSLGNFILTIIKTSLCLSSQVVVRPCGLRTLRTSLFTALTVLKSFNQSRACRTKSATFHLIASTHRWPLSREMASSNNLARLASISKGTRTFVRRESTKPASTYPILRVN
jgi:hypothetical protein